MGSCFTALTGWALPYLYQLRQRKCDTEGQMLHRTAECGMIAKGLPQQLPRLRMFAAILQRLVAGEHLGRRSSRFFFIINIGDLLRTNRSSVPGRYPVLRAVAFRFA
jgi:hypothetical protein